MTRRALPLLFLAAALSNPAAAAPEPAPIDFVSVIQHAKEEIFPKTVFIQTVLETYTEGQLSREPATASGVIISSDGYVVTNYHVVNKAISVRCILAEKSQWDAEIIGKDEDTDLALLKLEMPKDHPPLGYAEFGDSNALQAGDFVMAMGCPFGLSRSVSFGVVSNPDQYIESRSASNNWIQTDASINPGNSGGPLVNIAGKVVGINTMEIEGSGLGFAIPSAIVTQVVTQLREHGRVERSYIGVELQALKDFETGTFVDAPDGVLVGGIVPGASAQEAGLQVGDVLQAVNGIPLHGLYVENLPDVSRVLASLTPGKTAAFSVLRAGKPLEVPLTPRSRGAVQGGNFDCPEWMLTLKEINQFENLWQYYMRKNGVYILGIGKDANADRSGLKAWDIVVSIDGKDIRGLDDAKAAYVSSLQKPAGQRKALFEIIRRGLPQKVVLDYNRSMASYEAEK